MEIACTADSIVSDEGWWWGRKRRRKRERRRRKRRKAAAMLYRVMAEGLSYSKFPQSCCTSIEVYTYLQTS
jgi:hypothetical protein